MEDSGGHRDTPLRPFVVTGGRGPAHGLSVDTLLKAVPTGSPLPLDAPPQLRDLLRLCRGGVLSIAEAAAHLDLPVSVVLILTGDLTASRHLEVYAGSDLNPPSTDLLQEVLDGLRQL